MNRTQKNHSTAKAANISPQMMQPLEPRRMMSLTAGFDAAPISPPPPAESIQINHSFGFEPQFQNAADAPVRFPAPPPMQITPPLAAPSDSDSLEAQFAHAIAQGSPIVLAPANGADAEKPAPLARGSVTLSSLYSTIGTSTVSEIDNAAPTVLEKSVPGSAMIAAFDGSSQVVRDTPAATPPADSTAKAAAASSILLATTASELTTGSRNSLVRFDAEIAAVAPTADQSPHPAGALISREMLQSLEQELLAVTTYSRELAWNMGRDRAVELAHAEVSPGAGSSAASLSRWQSTATVIGAAIASLMYAQNEIVRGRKKVGSIFSDKALTAGLGEFERSSLGLTGH